MVTVTRNTGCISVQGHANYAESGKDIVCAGVSILVQTLIAALEELVADKVQYDVQLGTVNIKHGELTKEARLLVDSFFVGIRMIAIEYPDNVCLKCP